MKSKKSTLHRRTGRRIGSGRDKQPRLKGKTPSFDTAFFDEQDLLELDEEEEFLREDADLIEDEDPEEDTGPIEDLSESLDPETYDRPVKEGAPIREAEEEDLLSDAQVRDFTQEFEKIPEDIADLEAGEPAPKEYDAYSDDDDEKNASSDPKASGGKDSSDKEEIPDEDDFYDEEDEPYDEEDTVRDRGASKRGDHSDDRNKRSRKHDGEDKHAGKQDRAHRRRDRRVKQNGRAAGFEKKGGKSAGKAHAGKEGGKKKGRSKDNKKTAAKAAANKKTEKKPVRLSAFEWVAIAMSGLLVVTAVSLGLMYARIRHTSAQAQAYREIGSDLSDLKIIGESGLLAVRDASALRLSMLAEEEEPEIIEEEEEPVEEESKIVEIAMNLTSIKSDLKIKIVNAQTGKLVASVPFAVTAKAPSGKEETWEDDDRDGIIYRKGVEAGTWSITMKALGGDYEEGYTLPAKSKTVSVKDKIEYKKVDVADEIKKESQVNVAVEDTEPKAAAAVESVNQDTVEWVESSREEVGGEGGEYQKIDRDDIDKSFSAARMTLDRWRTRAANPSSDPNEGQEDSSGESNTAATGGSTAQSESSTEASTGASNASAGDSSTASTGSSNASEGNSGSASTGGSTASTEASTAAATGATSGTGKTAAEAVEKKITVSDITVFAGAKADLTVTSTGLTEKKYTYESDNTDIAKVSSDGSVTGVKDGKVKISVRAAEDNTVVGSCYVTVTSGKSLKTKSGQTVYVKSGDSYREAVTADYYVDDVKFYIHSGEKKYIYHGWQTIDGHTYYYDKNGNYVTGDQVILGVSYHFGSDGILSSSSGALGVDVSKWNGKIDWKAVKNSGVSYAIIRCGYRGTSSGVLVEDSSFRTNMQGALNAGLKVGAYFFSAAVNDVEAVEEASMAASLCSGYRLSYPVFLDVEKSSSGSGRADKISTADRTAVIRAFCATMANSGYKTGLYANKTWMESMIDTPSLTGYKLWLAQYAAKPSYSRTRFDMWQYTSSGSIGGISGKVDLNVSYLGY